MTFEAWTVELKKVAVAVYGFDPSTIDNWLIESYKDYFDDGFSPAEAMSEDMSYA